MPKLQDPKKMSRAKFIIIVLFLANIIQALFIIFRPGKESTQIPDTKPLRDSITMYKKQANQINSRISGYMSQIDSLSSLPPKIELIYAKQRIIIDGATIDQLDSIIRSNSGI